MRPLGAFVVLLVFACAGAATRSSVVAPAASQRAVLIQVERGVAATRLRSHGAEPLSSTLGIWRVPAAGATALLPALRRSGVLRRAVPERSHPTLDHLLAGDSLLGEEWWLAAVGADRAEPPGPGKPVTVIDSGLDLTHPEFLTRQYSAALNEQELTAGSQFHGTAVGSIVAAPANGIGLVGVYPQAVLYTWDGDSSGELTNSEVIAGVEAASARGTGVINLSFGSSSFDALEKQAILAAFRRGLLIVAAAGNERRGGSPTAFPASLPHVLTVAATDERGGVAPFSSASPAVDLAAPGQNIPFAVPTRFRSSGFTRGSGTSFAAPIVSGAAAWVWTARPDLDNTQLSEILRRSARDIGATGFDTDTGFGLLDIPAALGVAAPARDPAEPNEDVELVRPNGAFALGTASLTAPNRPRGSIEARLTRVEDPADLYRVWIPARRRVDIRLRAVGEVDLEVWRPATTSVARGRRQNLVVASMRLGAAETVAARNTGARGGFHYVRAFLPKGVPEATYSLSLTTPAR